MIFENFITFFSKVLFFTGLVNDKSSFPKPLTKAEEAKYIHAFHDGDMDARELLIKHNLRLVAHIVKKYNGAAEADDLLGCGTIGLIKAINTFKPEKGTQISTYAARCIENEILMFLRVNKKHQNVGSLNESLGSERDGTDICLADIICANGISGSSGADLNNPECLDDIDLAEHDLMMKKLVKEMQKRLSAREFKIIALRYGIENNIALPQREVAHRLNISRSYISRIEKHAIEIIRNIVNEKEFKDALN